MTQPLLVLALAVVVVVVLVSIVLQSIDKRAEALRRLARAEAALHFDLSAVRARYQRDTGLSNDEVERIEREFRRYFLLVALSPRVMLGLHNGKIDDFWHTAITFTATYRAYCNEVAGRFIDHDPAGGGDLPYARTYEAYQHVFDEMPDPVLWPAPDPRHVARLQKGKADSKSSSNDISGYSTPSYAGSPSSGHSGSHGHACGAGHGCSAASCGGAGSGCGGGGGGGCGGSS